MKKVRVDNEKCFGCGACVATDPEHFAFDDNGLSKVISEKNVEGNTTLEDTVESCPVGAIELFETDCTNEKCTCNPCTCGEDCKCNDID